MDWRPMIGLFVFTCASHSAQCSLRHVGSNTALRSNWEIQPCTREAIGEATTFGDTDTADLFTEISRGIDHQLWFVESHVDPK